MHRALRHLAVLGCAFQAYGLSAQLSFGGVPLGADARRSPLPAAPMIELPAVDVLSLLAEDAHNEATGRKGPYRFGFQHATDISTENAGIWHTLDNGGRVWRVELHCPQALGIGVTFSEYAVPDGGRVFLYNRDGKVLGGFSAQSNPGHTKLGVQPLAGEAVIVEYQEPATTAHGSGHLTIGNVIHVYRGLFSADRDLGDSGPCNINTICPEGDNWRPEIRSVALVLAGNGSCTGTLLNNCNNDSIPYFLTANHCLEGGDPTTWVFRFNWESPTCDPTDNGPTDHTVSGSTQLVANPGSDMLFLQLNSQPPPEFDVTYSGWDATGAVPDSGVCIHHPSGDIKKISHDNNPQAQQNVDVGNGPADCWHVFNWDSGTTEPGSSGSGLWNQDHRIVGQLYGGSANCSNNVDDYFGRFDVSYPLLTQWLGECDTLSGLDPGYTEPVIMNDAAITSIASVPANVCNDTVVAPLITLKNNGAAYLENVSIAYGIVGGASSSINWSGNLAPDQTANVQLPAIAILNGPQTLVVETSAPNGQSDGNLNDDSFSIDFVANTPGEMVTLNLVPDNYGIDITWELTNEDGTVLYSGGPYANNDVDPIIREFCLGDACYTFTINDVFGDGICCLQGAGHYSITSAFGPHVESDGQYEYGEVREFCLEGVGISEESHDDLQLSPNPTTGRLTVSLPANAGSQVPWTLIDMTGRAVATGAIHGGTTRADLDLGSFAEGSYTLHFIIRGTPVTKRVILRR